MMGWFKMKIVWLCNLNLEQEMKILGCGDWTCKEKGRDWGNLLLTDEFMYILALFPGVRWRRLPGCWSHYWCAGSQGRDMAAREPPWEQNGLPPMVNIMWVASARSRSVRRASHQPASMRNSLTISHMW